MSTPTANPEQTNFRWLVIALAFLITIVNYLDRSAIAYAIGPLKHEFHLNDADFGVVAGAFGLGYMLMTVGGGILVDKWGARRIWSGAALVWSCVTAALGLSNGFLMLCALRTMLGLAEGPHFPSLTRVVTDWLPISERGRATAFGLAAVPMAAVVGAPLISHLIIAFGWKLMFLILGCLGLSWVFIWFWIFRDYPENCPQVSPTELSHIRDGAPIELGATDEQLRQHDRQQGKTTWKFMLLNPSLMANNLAFFAFGYLLFFAMTWLPGFLEETYAVRLKDVGLFLIAPWLTASILLPFAGWLSDQIWIKTHSTRKARSHMIWICQLLSALCFAPVIMFHSLPVALTFISLGVGIGLMPNAAFYAINSDMARDRAGTSLGIMDSFFALAGILAPVLTGMLATATGGFNAAILLLMFFTITSVVAIAFFQHPDKDIMVKIVIV